MTSAMPALERRLVAEQATLKRSEVDVVCANEAEALAIMGLTAEQFRALPVDEVVVHVRAAAAFLTDRARKRALARAVVVARRFEESEAKCR